MVATANPDEGLYIRTLRGAWEYFGSWGFVDDNYSVLFKDDSFTGDLDDVSAQTSWFDWTMCDSTEKMAAEIQRLMSMAYRGSASPATLAGGLVFASWMLKPSYPEVFDLAAASMQYLLHKYPSFWADYDVSKSMPDFDFRRWFFQNYVN